MTTFAKRHLPAIVISLSTLSGIAVSRAGESTSHAADATDQAAQAEFGPAELLQQKLVQASVSDRLLNNAVRQFNAGQSAAAFRAVRLILSEPQDSFTRVDVNAAAVSVQDSARRLLQDADYAIRRDWIAAQELTAESELQQALSSHDAAALRAVSRTYPFTRAARRSLQLQALTAIGRGQLNVASQLLSEITELYINTPLPYSAEQAAAVLRAEIAKAQRTLQSAGSAAAQVTRAGSPYQTTVPELSLPWTKPLWSWTERYWSHPASASVLSPISDDSQTDLLSANTWQSLLVADRVLFRSPLRVICFDRLSGNVEWSLRTDTGATVDPASIGEGKPIWTRPPVDANQLLQMERFGTMCGDDEFLFFVDGFRPFNDSSDSSTTVQHVLPGPLGGQFGNRFTLPDEERPRSAGSRLVAVQLSSPPRVAWTVGGHEAFGYEFTSDDDAATEPGRPADMSVRVVASQADDPFQQHRFLGVPLIHDRSLFVITSDGEQLFLNCLNRSSGRLSWRQPLTFDETAVGDRRYPGSQAVRSAELSALCGVADDSVICSLPDGIVIAVNRSDGRLKWATDTSGPDEADGGRLDRFGPPRGLYSVSSSDDTQGFHPVICGDRIFHAAPVSKVLSCVDVRTGRIQWQVSRQVVGAGVVNGSRDLYAAGCTDSALVLIGQRHLRVVEPHTGIQIRVTEIPPQTGRAICDDRLCLIPVRDGSIVAVDLASGCFDTLAGVFSLQHRAQFVGSLVADDSVICATTPVSVAVIPSAAEIRRRFDRLPEDERSAAAGSVSAATAEVLSGNHAVGLQRLLSLSRQRDSADLAQPVLADILLHLLAEERFEIQAGLPVRELPPELAATEQMLTTLQQLKLSREQSLRMHVLSNDHSALPLIAAGAAGETMLKLFPDWQVRADVAAWSTPASHTDSPTADVPAATPPTLASAARAISFPGHIGTVTEQMQFADELLRQHRPAAAHLLLEAAGNLAGSQDAASATARLQHLRSTAGARRPSLERSFVPGTVQISMRETRLKTIDRFLLKTLAEGLRSQLDAPPWFEHRLLTSPSPIGLQLSVLDMHAGSVIHEILLPTSIHQTAAQADSLGLLPLVDGDQIGMLSLTGRDGPEVLWHKRVDSDGSPVSGIQPGPIGAGYFVWKTDSQLSCSHSLTGDLLWSRKLAMPASFTAAAPLSGDDLAVAVFGSGMNSYQLFRTRDGRHLRDGQLDVPAIQTPLTIGRRLLYVDDDRRIRLLDLLTGQDVLNTQTPLRITEHGRASVLPNNRVATVTDDRRLLVIDADHAAVELSCPLPDDATANPFTGLVTFERDGRLFVLLRNYRHSDQSVSATPLLQEPRLDYGTLLCIDQTSQELLWTMNGQPAVVPPIYGDPTELMLLWSIVDPLDARRLGQNGLRQNGNLFGDDTQRTTTGRERSLVLRVIDSRTGQTIARQSGFSPSTPLRCVHDADARQIRVEMENSVIMIDYVPVAGP